MRRAFASVLLVICGSAAEAHSWYPLRCCSGRDCYEISPGEVSEVSGGWRILATGEVMPFAKVQFSPDGHYHRCSTGGDRRQHTICLFVPPPGV